jgi:SAM-dependent methyltransferase
VTDEDLNASAIYDAMAADYVANEDNPFNAYYEQPSVRALLPPLAGQRILDAGCGAGRATEWLTQQGAAPVGIDASAQMVRRARERFPGNSFVLANLAKPLPLEDASLRPRRSQPLNALPARLGSNASRVPPALSCRWPALSESSAEHAWSLLARTFLRLRSVLRSMLGLGS